MEFRRVLFRSTRAALPLSLIISTNDAGVNVKTVEALKNQWSELGVQVILRILPNDELIENIVRTRQYEVLLIMESSGHDPDPFPFWHSSQTIDPGLNLSMLKDQEVDNVIINARATSDTNTRQQLYSKFLTLIQKSNPAIFLVQPNYIYVINEKILGVNINSLNLFNERFAGVSEWYIKTKRTVR